MKAFPLRSGPRQSFSLITFIQYGIENHIKSNREENERKGIAIRKRMKISMIQRTFYK